MGSRSKGQGNREVAPGGTHMSQGPAPQLHSPSHSQVLLSGRALQGGPGDTKTQAAGPSLWGVYVYMWVLWLPGRGKRGVPHLFAFGSTVPAVTLRTKNDQVGECPAPHPYPAYAHSPWGPDFLEHQENPEI